MTDEARRAHYGVFYGLDPLPTGPLTLVHGNCQAESLRIMVDGPGMATVRLPPVHELTDQDLDPLHRLIAATTLLITQPVRDDYRNLPVGTRLLRRLLPASALSVTVPVIRFAGLYPFQVIVRSPTDPSLVPPMVPYHDLRVLAEAAGLAVPERIPPGYVRDVAAGSVAELRRRESMHEAVPVSDLFLAPSFDQMRTVNHPGNPVFLVLAARIRSAVGLPAHVTDPGRELLSGVQAPREECVIDAFGLTDEPVGHWTVDGEAVDAGAVREEHLRWYADHPDVITAGLERHRDTLTLLGIGGHR